MARRNKRFLGFTSAFAVVVLLTGLLVAIGAPQVSADIAAKARGYAYGVSEDSGEGPVAAPESTSEVPPPPDQPRKRQETDTEVLVSVLSGIVEVSRLRTTACLQPGTPAALQAEIDRANYLAQGGDPDLDTAPPETTQVFVPPGYPTENQCVTPVDGRTDDRSGPPSAEGGPAPSGSPTGSPSGSPTGSPRPSGSPSPTGSPAPPAEPCEDFVSIEESGPRCIATLPLWNARGYARTLHDDLLGIIDEVESEALARCENGQVLVSTGARFGLVTGFVNPDTEQPNQELDLSVAGGGVVTFWETNWDPETNTTTDGSDTVYVNGLHISTPVDDIIVAHSEATATCPGQGEEGGPAPPGGFPRDVNLEVAKKFFRYGSTFTLGGAVTPATTFQTPHRCVEGARVTIRRDIIGGAEDYQDVGTVSTDAQGHFSFNYKADRSANWLAQVVKDSPKDCAESTSLPQPILIRVRLEFRTDDKTPERGSTFTLRTRLIPCEGEHAGSFVKLRQDFDGRMAQVQKKRTDATCVATFPVVANFDTEIFDTTWPKQDVDHQFSKSRPKVIQTD